MKTLIATTVLAALLSGCVSLLPDSAPPNITYRLSLTGESVEPQPGATVIRVDRPASTSIFNSRKIIVSPDGRRLSSLALAEWPEAAPTMLQETLVDAFSRVPSIVGVLPQSGARTDTRVHVTIKNFEARFDRGEKSAPLAVVRYSATLANATDRKLIDTFTTSHTVRADAPRVSDIVTALEAANAAAMSDIVQWVVNLDQTGIIEDPVTLPTLDSPTSN